MTINFKGVVASAPGKVILFGEHAVVYGVTAIAAALSDLRIFVEIDPTIEETIEVRMHDIVEGPECKSFSRQISLSRLRDLFHESPTADALSPIDPNTVILDKLRKEFQDAPIAAAQGLMAIMYIIANVLPECLWSNTISVAFHGGMLLNINSKGLPIGAGLGSSAAFSVALAAAALRLRQQLYPFLLVGGGENVAIALNETVDSVSSADIDEPLLSNSSATIPLSLLPIINGWAYAAEVVIHGTPSGLDNTTSCYGGAVRFRKGEDKFENITNGDLPEMRILLTNTRVPRSTKLLVAGVNTLYGAIPKVVQSILEGIEALSMKFLEIVAQSKTRKEEGDVSSAALEKETAEIGLLFRTNHHLLCALGVGHPSLSAVVEASASHGLSCKLTGAGGGGCAITLLPARKSRNDNLCERGDELCPEIDHDEADNPSITKLKTTLGAIGFETFESALAGDGVQWP